MLQTSAESETRTLAGIGIAVVLCCVIVAGLYEAAPFSGRADNRISVAVDTPYAVQGVAKGTPVVMHGVEVGKVIAVSSLPGGFVRLTTALQKKPVAGLTDTMQIDFRPANYFGVTGINLTPGTGGRALHDGMRINTVPKGNFTLQALLSRVGELSTGVITQQLIDVIDRATRYTDAMNPLIETMLIAANALAKVQTVPTARLLANTTGLSVAFPPLLNAATDAGDAFSRGDANYLHRGLGDFSDEELHHVFLPTMSLLSNGVFGSIGNLEGRHVADLLPLINGFKPIIDAIPPLLRPVGVGDMLVELRSRLEKLYAGTPEQRAVQVRIVLDSLPGVAAPLGVMGGR
ncbi:Mammalian cell entry related domain protein [Mycobacterium colombiense]|uniref:MlaD family protein n=1 Tax=Mycobacterium colombiense TaxID=339268 RepID=UPI0008021FD2|nr:Mammalian cell entry related domain protein [Mycobacterium colombiense]